MKNTEHKTKITERPPVVTVMGHIDHGKSTLLDYIRKTAVVDQEVGGITQKLSAYEAVHKNEAEEEKKITFLDTPGHEAFSKMRYHSASAADIAILIVSAEDGVKAQTMEAYKAIKESGIPFVVAINKIDRPNANIEKTKTSLTENEIYLEGYGGDVPSVEISAKTGAGISELLDMVLLLADMEKLEGDASRNAEGVVIESHQDPKKGIVATLLIKNGSLKKGMVLTVGKNMAPIRAIENFLGAQINEAQFSMPVRIGGWDELPQSGDEFVAHKTKQEAKTSVRQYEFDESAIGTNKAKNSAKKEEKNMLTVPLVIKADAAGAIDAIIHEIDKIRVEGLTTKILATGVGAVTENDIRNASAGGDAIILGFGVKADGQATMLAERFGVTIALFDIIYKLAEWLAEELEKRRPRVLTEEKNGLAKVIRIFGGSKGSAILGGRVTEGSLSLGDNVKILRRDFEIGRGKILELQQQKLKTKQVNEGLEFGAKVEAKQEIAPGDVLEAFVLVNK
ncbi:MAG: translation initiation factor IF-2 [Parcubacteria group bacterium]|nr:translation initiation factor IF-2 [Parcubacteria group bacterium]